MPPADVPGVRVERFLGAGAFGQVWIGRDLNTGRGVAVKFYLHRGGVNWSLLSREVKNLVQLSANRHVVQVLEVGWDADPPYYVMELVEGGSLEDMLLRRGRLPLGEAVDLFYKICIGLNHCHGKGVLHCDVKPANILLATDNEPKLADFGQSRMSHDQTPAMGTLFYMAPEQADLNSTPDARWDVYAAGAMLYRMLTGNAPHRDQSLLSQLDTAGSLPGRLSRYREAIASAPSAIDSMSRRGIDRPLRRILEQCLQIDPKKRYANMQQVLDDLKRRDDRQRRRPLTLLGIVGPILLLITTCVYGIHSINKATDAATSALRTEARGSNQLAARFAAQTLETEIERYFDLTEEESSRNELGKLLRETLSDPDMESSLAQIAASQTPRQALSQTAARDVVLDSSARKKLNAYLDRRLELYTSDEGLATHHQRLASLFVVDASGTIFSIAYGNHVSRAQDSVGRNFAYRTYFSGRRDDLPNTTSIADVRPLNETHLSSAFQSTATGLWKVAISTPIRFQPTSAPENEQESTPIDTQPVDAVFVATINVGDFELLRENKSSPIRRTGSQVAVLVEARQGPLRGTVLQHPLMDRQRDRGDTLSDQRFQVASELVDELLQGGDVDYRDPMARASDGDQYAGQWIAAMQPVTLPDTPSSATDRSTDLLVLVQYRLADVLDPVGQLRRSLIRQGLAAIASILAVTFVLWWVVRRIGEDDEPTDPGNSDDSEKTPDAIETMTVA